MRSPLKWKIKKLVWVSFVAIVLYLIFISKMKNNMRFQAVIKNSKPENVWEFVADFSNMVKLNPTM